MLIFAYLLLVLGMNDAATTVKHSHIRGNDKSKERTEDGSYSPRDAHHHEDGEHHSEFDHEAILGSVKEAEEYDQLSPDESKRRLAKLVVKMDLNQDQFIDRHELKAWILRSFKKLSEEEASERFEELDENADGKVTWDEYVRDVFDMEPGKEDSLPVEQKLMWDDDREMFFTADLNKDGVLNSEEFVLFQSPEEHPEMLPLILQQTLRSKDTNKDGVIDFQEFIGGEAQDHDKEWLLVEKDKFDNDYDKNKDGYLAGNEILSWMVPSNEEVASDEVDHLFAAADDNHDDRLSYQEIIDHYDTFVGSEATDYGDQLHDEL